MTPEAAIYWVGMVTVVAGTGGLLAAIIIIAIERVVRLSGYSSALLQAWFRLQDDKRAERETRG